MGRWQGAAKGKPRIVEGMRYVEQISWVAAVVQNHTLNSRGAKHSKQGDP